MNQRSTLTKNFVFVKGLLDRFFSVLQKQQKRYKEGIRETGYGIRHTDTGYGIRDTGNGALPVFVL